MNVLTSIIWTVVCVLCQVLVFRHLSLAGGIVLFYVYAMIKIPVEWNRSLQILYGFIVGFMLDMFCNTPGMHALACTTVMWLRIPIIHMFIVADEIKTGVPDSSKLSFSVFIRYTASVILLLSVLLYFIEAFTVFNWVTIIAKVTISALLTFSVVLAMEMLSTKRKN